MKRPMHVAAETGHGELLKHLVDKYKADPNSKDIVSHHMTHFIKMIYCLNSLQHQNLPMHYAIEMNHSDVVRYLITLKYTITQANQVNPLMTHYLLSFTESNVNDE